MFSTLLESRAARVRRAGSSVASVIIHSVIVTAAVAATARDTLEVTPEPLVMRRVEFRRPADPRPVASRQVAVTSASMAPGPFLQRLVVPVTMPVGIPPIDLSATPTTGDFRPTSFGSPGITCERDCAGSVSDAMGRDVWTTRDIMMRLLADPVAPRYPESLRRAGVEGEVVVKFEVDTTGRVDMRTVEILRSTHDAFTIATRESLERLRFAPAMSGEHRVRALAVMPFRFTLR